MEKKAFVLWLIFFSAVIFGITFFGVLNSKELKERELTKKATDSIKKFTAENFTKCTVPYRKKTTSCYIINAVDSITNTPQWFRFNSYSTHVFDQKGTESRKCFVTIKHPLKWSKNKWISMYPSLDKKEITLLLEYTHNGFSFEQRKQLFSFLPEKHKPVYPNENYCEELKKQLNVK